MTKPHRRIRRVSTKRHLALAAAAVLSLAACGGSDSSSAGPGKADGETATTVTETTPSDGAVDTEEDSGDASADDSSAGGVEDERADDGAAGDGAADDAAAEDDAPEGEALLDNCSTSQAPIQEQVYSVSNIPADDPAGGLVARLLPGASGEPINVLPDGTIVDIFDGDPCTVLADGTVWWFVNTPLLATGGFVNSAFLAGQTDLGQESDGNAEGDGQDDFDTALAQVDCIYNGGDESCALLVTFLIGTPEDNYGLGNSYSMAPSGFLAEDCLVSFDVIACAELDSRGPGGDLEAIGRAYITAYQTGDVSGQEAVSGDRNTTEINSVDLTDGQGEFGLASANFFGTEMSWTPQPTISARCIVTGGLVQYCVVIGD